MLAYAGIGSRDITEREKTDIFFAAATLRARGWLVYSGNADGSDVTFQRGSENNCVVFLPWRTFNEDVYDCGAAKACFIAGDSTEGIASISYYHPQAARIMDKQGVRALMARNYHQVMGFGDYPQVRFVLCCATPNGKGVEGGTGQAVRIARDKGIPVLNIREDGWKTELDRLTWETGEGEKK